ERWAGLALVAGVAAKEALEGLGVRSIEIEWPNDLVVGPRKLGGILCEVRGRGADAWIALGIGVNINLESREARRRVPPELRDRIICATAAGPPTTRDPERIGRAVLDAFWPLYERHQSGEPLGDIVKASFTYWERPVRARLPDGTVLSGKI